jgi:hypothetical protein
MMASPRHAGIMSENAGVPTSSDVTGGHGARPALRVVDRASQSKEKR